MLREACSRLLLLRWVSPCLARSGSVTSSYAAAPLTCSPATGTFHLPTSPAAGHLLRLLGDSCQPSRCTFQSASCYSNAAPRRGAGGRGRRPAPVPRSQHAAAGKVAGPGGDSDGGNREQEQEEGPNAEPEEEEGVHKYFPLIGRNKMQPYMELSEVERCQALMSSSLWLRLSESPLQAAWLHWVRRPLREAVRLLFQSLLSRAEEVSTEMVQECVDGSFDRQEFLEGATAALELTLNHFAPLRQMHSRLQDLVSDQVLADLSSAHTELEDTGWDLQSVSAHVHGAELVTCNLWSAESVERFDKSWAQQVTPSTSSSWLVLTVTAKCTMSTTSTASSSSSSGSQEPLTRTQRMHKYGSVFFARGPLPRGPQPRLEGLPWRIIGMC